MDPAAGEFVLKIYEETRAVATFPLTRAVELGRREGREPMPYARLPRESDDRLVIADLTETSVSRRHLRIELQGPRQVLLKNESTKANIILPGGRKLGPGEQLSIETPLACELGAKVVHLDWRPMEEEGLRSLSEPTLAPGRSSGLFTRRFGGGETGLATLVPQGDSSELLMWLQASMEVFQSAAASADFLYKAVQSASQMVDLDTVAVVLRENGRWSVAAGCHQGEPLSAAWLPSETMLQRVTEHRRTFFHVPSLRVGLTSSLQGVHSVIAAPILDATGQVIGVFYGEGRRGTDRRPPRTMTDLEAKLFELLAYGVASGLARVSQERKLIAERVRFEQFFTPELARELQARGDEMLAAREADVTVLFCDIKGFSRISSQSGALLAIEWVREVLSELSDCVAEFQGVLVDYGGDSLEALWGAPLPATDHAAQACRAAIHMRETLPALNERWQARLGQVTDISIGINSGRAQVGNIGSRRKFKYGAFGTTVNLASRVQSATKFLGTSILASRATVEQAGMEYAFRRLATVRTVNIAEPVELYELESRPTATWQLLRTRYEEALRLFEAGNCVEAMAGLGGLLADFPADEPTRRLLQRNVACLGKPPESFSPVWELDAK